MYSGTLFILLFVDVVFSRLIGVVPNIFSAIDVYDVMMRMLASLNLGYGISTRYVLPASDIVMLISTIRPVIAPFDSTHLKTTLLLELVALRQTVLQLQLPKHVLD